MKNRLHYLLIPLLPVALSTLSACAPVVIGAAGGGGFAMATDERTVGTQIDDATLSTTVKTRLIEEADIPARKIDVDVLEGEVILTGVVDTREQKQKAVEIAGHVEGVRKVTDNLQVGIKTIGDSFNDKVLVTRINKDLLLTPEIRSFNIDVDADRGVVTLTGIVDTAANKLRILSIARETPGAIRVVDNLKVR
jgi:hyperosmotically inducible protein